MSFVERFIILCPYLGGSTIGGFTVHVVTDILYFTILIGYFVQRQLHCTYTLSMLVHGHVHASMYDLT